MASIGLLIICIALYCLVPEKLQTDTRFAETELIHLFLAQFYHIDTKHLLFNGAALLLITWGWGDQFSPFQWLITLVLSLLATPAWLCLVEPITWYFGLSGALHAQFTVLLLITLIKPNKGQQKPVRSKLPAGIMALGLIIKLAIEATKEQNLALPITEQIAYEAHRGGALAGAFIVLLLLIIDKIRAGITN